MMPLIPPFDDEQPEGALYQVINCLLETLATYLNEWAAKGYYPCSAPQVYMDRVLSDGPMVAYVLQVVEFDEHRWKLEGSKR